MFKQLHLEKIYLRTAIFDFKLIFVIDGRLFDGRLHLDGLDLFTGVFKVLALGDADVILEKALHDLLLLLGDARCVDVLHRLLKVGV